MQTLYKLTRQNNTTSAAAKTVTWGDGVSHTATGYGARLCSPDVIHAYTHPLLAVLLNPIHASYENPKLWKCEGEVIADDHGLTVGVKTLTSIEEMLLPVVTTEQRVKFAILCAKQVYKDVKWDEWADRWSSGEDRSAAAALAALERTSSSIGWAARAAEGAARAGWAATPPAAGWKRPELEVAATAAEYAVRAAAVETKAIDLIALAIQATQI